MRGDRRVVPCHYYRVFGTQHGNTAVRLHDGARGYAGVTAGTAVTGRAHGGYGRLTLPAFDLAHTRDSDCHGLQFSMNAMTDPLLIKSNFSSPPTQSHPGIQWTTEATLKRGGEDAERILTYLESLKK